MVVVHLKSQLLRRLRQENRLNPGDGGCSEPRLQIVPLHSSLGNRERLRLTKTKSKNKQTIISQAWWRTSVDPATRNAEAEELLKPRRQRLQ